MPVGVFALSAGQRRASVSRRARTHRGDPRRRHRLVFEATIWFGFLAPAGTPKEIVDKLYAEMKKAVESGALSKKLRAMNDQVELVAKPGDQFHSFIGKEIDRWRPRGVRG